MCLLVTASSFVFALRFQRDLISLITSWFVILAQGTRETHCRHSAKHSYIWNYFVGSSMVLGCQGSLDISRGALHVFRLVDNFSGETLVLRYVPWSREQGRSWITVVIHAVIQAVFEPPWWFMPGLPAKAFSLWHCSQARSWTLSEFFSPKSKFQFVSRSLLQIASMLKR